MLDSENFRETAGKDYLPDFTFVLLQRSEYGAIEGDFALCISLYHGCEVLEKHGLRTFHNHLEGLVSGEKVFGRAKAELQRSVDIRELLDQLRPMFQPIK